MFRLKNITTEDLISWKEERLRIGQERYGDSDLDRYNLVDVMEELLDAQNILERMENRLKVQERKKVVFNLTNGYSLKSVPLRKSLTYFISVLADLIAFTCYALDEFLSDEMVTDNNGGDRLWLGKINRAEEGMDNE